jgi:hypothetical protein
MYHCIWIDQRLLSSTLTTNRANGRRVSAYGSMNVNFGVALI